MNLSRFGAVAAASIAAVGSGAGATTAVSISSSSERPRAALSARRGRSRRSAPLTLSSGPVTPSATSRFQPSGWIVADLCRPGAFRSRRDEEPAERHDDRRAGRVQAPPALRRARAGPSSSDVSFVCHPELEVDERCHALGPHGVDDEEREREHDRLRGDRKPREARHDREREAAREVLRADADRDRGEHAAGDERRRLAPGGEQPDDEIPRVGERVRAEEDPREADDLEGHEAMPRAAAARPRPLDEPRPLPPPALDDERGAVDPAPDDERPAGAVPEPADEHRQHQVAVREERPAAVAAERDVEVVAQPARERHVPAPPEVGDRRRRVRARRSSAGSVKPSRSAIPIAMFV